MDSAHYKDLVNTRGYKYHYYAIQPRDGKLTLLFVHGWPNTSRDWRRIVPYLQERGYGIIVPDMLGYGGTDKPTDPEHYQFSLLTQDLVYLLDAEGAKHAVAIGHDWGSLVVCRLANFAPERFVAYAVFCLAGSIIPDPQYDVESFIAKQKQLLGYEPFGYWFFLAEEGAHKLIEDNIETLLSVVHGSGGGLKELKTYFMQRGGLKATLLSKYRGPIAGYMSEEDQRIFIDTFSNGGMAAPLCYYQLAVSGARNSDDQKIPEDHRVPPVSSPLFYGASLQDAVCHPAYAKAEFAQDALKNHNVTIRDFDTNHWLLMNPATSDKVSHELGQWVEDVVVPTVSAGKASL